MIKADSCSLDVILEVSDIVVKCPNCQDLGESHIVTDVQQFRLGEIHLVLQSSSVCDRTSVIESPRIDFYSVSAYYMGLIECLRIRGSSLSGC
jgi:hypothetical protein